MQSFENNENWEKNLSRIFFIKKTPDLCVLGIEIKIVFLMINNAAVYYTTMQESWYSL